MQPPPETTVGQLAQQLGVSVDRVLEVCGHHRILVWSDATPLGQQEASQVWNTIQPPPPPPAPDAFGAAPTTAPPPTPWAVPAPPVAGPSGPPGPPVAPVAPWATTPTHIGTFPPPPRTPQNRTGWIIAAACVGVLGFLAAVGFLVGTTDDEPSGGSFSFGDDETADAEDLTLGAPAEVEAPVLRIPDYDRIGQTVGRPEPLDDFEIGDCVDLPDSFISDVGVETQTVFPKPVDCQGPHNAEVFQVGEFEAPSNSQAPPGDELFLAGGEACFDSFFAYIGSGFDEHDFVVLVPLDPQWERLDERTFTCFAYRLDADSTVGSMRERANG